MGLWEAQRIPQPLSDLCHWALWATRQVGTATGRGPSAVQASEEPARSSRDGGAIGRSVSPTGAQPREGRTPWERRGFNGKVFELYVLLRAVKPPWVCWGLVIFASIYLFWRKGLNQSS